MDDKTIFFLYITNKKKSRPITEETKSYIYVAISSVCFETMIQFICRRSHNHCTEKKLYHNCVNNRKENG